MKFICGASWSLSLLLLLIICADSWQGADDIPRLAQLIDETNKAADIFSENEVEILQLFGRKLLQQHVRYTVSCTGIDCSEKNVLQIKSKEVVEEPDSLVPTGPDPLHHSEFPPSARNTPPSA